MKLINRSRGVQTIYLNLIKKTPKVHATCNPLDFGKNRISTDRAKTSPWTPTPNMIFSVTCYLDLHGAISFY